MKTNAKSIIGIVIALVIGFILGAVIEFPESSKSMSGGSITKVSKYRQGIVSPELNAFKEKLLSDSTEMKKTATSLAFLSSRMTEFNGLVDIAIDASEDKEELAGNVETLKRIQSLSANAKLAGDNALESFNSLLEGRASGENLDYEQASRNLVLANMMVERQIKVGKEYVVAVDKYINNHTLAGNENLAAARDLWANYCAGNAILNQDEQELAYWNKKQQILSSDQLAAFVLGNNVMQSFAIRAMPDVDVAQSSQALMQGAVSSLGSNAMMNSILPDGGQTLGIFE